MMDARGGRRGQRRLAALVVGLACGTLLLAALGSRQDPDGSNDLNLNLNLFEAATSELEVNARAKHGKGTSALGRFPLAAGHQKDCLSPKFFGSTLKTVTESSFINLMLRYERNGFGKLEASRAALLDKYEASDVVSSKDGEHLYVVFDNAFEIGKVSRGITPGSESVGKHGNSLMQWPGAKLRDSQFEAIAHNHTSGAYLVLEETHPQKAAKGARAEPPRALVHEVSIVGTTVTVLRECDVRFDFASENKGFEGATVLSRKGKSYLLALCEGNFCKAGAKGRAHGNGRIVVLEQSVQADGSCWYEVRQVLKLPAAADFVDYSAVSVYKGQQVAVTSQENSAVWIGDILEAGAGDGVGDGDGHNGAELFKLSEGRVYDFPRNDNCEVVYCNIEGAYFLAHNLLVTVSDAMKNKGKQPFICHEHGQSMHLFFIP